MIKTIEEITAIATGDFYGLIEWYQELVEKSDRKAINEAIESLFGEIDPNYDFTKYECEFGELYNAFRNLLEENFNFNLDV